MHHSSASPVISKALLVARVVRGGIPDAVWAERALRATLATLGQRLRDDEAAALSAELPTSLARVVDQNEYDEDFDAAELYERVRRLEDSTIGDAREHAAVVLRALGEVLGEDLRHRLARALPPEVALHLAPRPAADVPAYRGAKHSRVLTTLATGRPGYRHPIAEAASPDMTHAHSVASANPHGETKLSSSHGLTQERLDESLASARLTDPRSIAEADDD